MLEINHKREVIKKFQDTVIWGYEKNLKQEALIYVKEIAHFDWMNNTFVLHASTELEIFGKIDLKVDYKTWKITWEYPFRPSRYWTMNGELLFIERFPARQWKVGACTANTFASKINVQGAAYIGLEGMDFTRLQQSHPNLSFVKSVEELKEKQQNTIQVSKSFALQRLPKWWRTSRNKTYIVYYKSSPIGWYNNIENTVLVHNSKILFLQELLIREVDDEAPVMKV